MGSLSEAIDAGFDNESPSAYRSSRVGASIVGNPCTAYLAFNVRGFPEKKIDPALKRIFRDGHRIESAALADLRKAGVHVQEKSPITGTQFCWDDLYGYLVYFSDGIIEGGAGEDDKLLEIKSMKNSLWNRFKKRGVRVSHPKYYDQMQMGMGLSGYKECVLLAYNKDTSEYWDQVVEFDPVRYGYLVVHAQEAILGRPEKVAKGPEDWRCRACPRAGVCWEGDAVPKDMRTCANAFPSVSGAFVCSKGCGQTCQDWRRWEPQDKK